MSSIKRVAILGAGRIAEIHLHGYSLLKENVDVCALVDIRIDQAQQRAARWGITKTFETLDALFSDQSLDAVDICLPHNAHVDAVKRVCLAGKHILLEKPIARSLNEADEILRAVREASVSLMVAHNHIFNELIEKVKSYIAGEFIGQAHLVKAHSLSWFSFTPNDFRKSNEENGGGAFIDTGTHFVYILQYLFGKIVNVSARFAHSPRREMEGEDDAIVILEFESGCLAEITISYSAKFPGWELGFPNGWDQDITIFGDKGAIRISLAREKFSIYSEAESVPKNLRGWTEIEMRGSYAHSYDREVSSFVDSLINGTIPKVKGEDARSTLAVIDAAYTSARANKTIKLTA